MTSITNRRIDGLTPILPMRASAKSRPGHVFQGRHKAILCQSDRYMGELVRCIHLNPVRAKMVRKAERYPYSSQRAYLGIEPAGVVDADPVLRLFGARKKKARENFAEFVAAGARLGHQEEFYSANEGCILGSDEFVDETIHRVGDADRIRSKKAMNPGFDAERSITAVESVFDLERPDFLGPSKLAAAVRAKEALILAGRELGATMTTLSRITGWTIRPSAAATTPPEKDQNRIPPTAR